MREFALDGSGERARLGSIGLDAGSGGEGVLSLWRWEEAARGGEVATAERKATREGMRRSRRRRFCDKTDMSIAGLDCVGLLLCLHTVGAVLPF